MSVAVMMQCRDVVDLEAEEVEIAVVVSEEEEVEIVVAEEVVSAEEEEETEEEEDSITVVDLATVSVTRQCCSSLSTHSSPRRM